MREEEVSAVVDAARVELNKVKYIRIRHREYICTYKATVTVTLLFLRVIACR